MEGKTDRTVQSYAETLHHFIRAVDQLQLPNSVEPSGQHMSTCSWAGCATEA